jgi:hypothetical protein
MDRMWLTRSDRIDTLTRGAVAGLIGGTLLGVLEVTAAVQSGDGLLWPWRMAASVVLGGGAFKVSAGEAFFTGIVIHLLLSAACGAVAAMLYEWSEWSHRYRAEWVLACVAGAVFGGLIWFVNFPLIAAGFLPWMWRLDQGVQLALHISFGVALGVALRELGRHALNPPDSAQTA